MAAWESELASLVADKRCTVTQWDSSAPSRKIVGAYGHEEEYRGFGHVIVYLPLRDDVQLDLLEPILRPAFRIMASSGLTAWSLDLFLLNDPDNRLVHVGQPIRYRHFSNAARGARDIQEIFAQKKSEPLGDTSTIYELAPLQNPYASRKIPGREDLCLAISGPNGIALGPEVELDYQRLYNRWVWVKTGVTDGVEPVEVLDGREYLKLHRGREEQNGDSGQAHDR